MGCALEVSALHKSFGGVNALSDIDLVVEPGELCGVIGPNGAGKSTLFALIAGSMLPTSGRIVLDGVDVSGSSAWQRARLGVGRTFQGTRQVDSLTVRENVALGADRHGSSGLLGALFHSRAARRDDRESRRAADDALDRVGLAGLADERPSALTAGQRRLLELARALALRPKVLLMDEPAAGLSHTEARTLRDVIVSLNEEGRTCLLIEHDVELVLGISSRVFVLDAGRRLAEGVPDHIRTNVDVVAAYLGAPVTNGVEP